MSNESKKGLNQFKILSEFLDPTILLEMFSRYLEHSEAVNWDSGTLEKTIKGYVINRANLTTLLTNSGANDNVFILLALREEYKDNNSDPIQPFIVPVLTTVNSSNEMNQNNVINNCLPLLSFHPTIATNVLPVESNTFANTLIMVNRYLNHYNQFTKTDSTTIETIKGYTIEREELNALILNPDIQDIAIILGVRFLETPTSTSELLHPYISPIIVGLTDEHKIIWEKPFLIDYCLPCPQACPINYPAIT